VKELSSTYAFKTPEIALYLQAPFQVELYECVVGGTAQQTSPKAPPTRGGTIVVPWWL